MQASAEASSGAAGQGVRVRSVPQLSIMVSGPAHTLFGSLARIWRPVVAEMPFCCWAGLHRLS